MGEQKQKNDSYYTWFSLISKLTYSLSKERKLIPPSFILKSSKNMACDLLSHFFLINNVIYKAIATNNFT